MPEYPPPRPHLHPLHALPDADSQRIELEAKQARGSSYVELTVTSNFSFLRGASHPEELCSAAASMGYQAIGLADHHTLAGAVRAHLAAKQYGLQLVLGTRVDLDLGTGSSHVQGSAWTCDEPATDQALSVLLYPVDRAGYGRLCRLLTVGKRRSAKGQCRLSLSDLSSHAEGLLAIVFFMGQPSKPCLQALHHMCDLFTEDRLSIALSRHAHAKDQIRLTTITALARRLGVPTVACNHVLYHTPQRRPLQDVLTCIRHRCTIEQAGLRLQPNAERCLRPPALMAELFRDWPDALRRTSQIAERASGFSLDQLRYEYPDEVCPPGSTPMSHLRNLCFAGAGQRYPLGIPQAVRERIEHELSLIKELNYPSYFLTVADIVLYARSRGILCQGRGAAANSAVCYCLGITAVDPSRVDLLFERFISRERNEPPDIDVDFEHERRDEVIQYIYERYGRERAGLTAELITYRGRSAVRDVGKVMGLSLDCVDQLARTIEHWAGALPREEDIRRLGLNPADPRLRRTLELTAELIGFPRHLSQHVGGFVITSGPLCEMVPIENAAMADRTVIEWDKDDIDAMGLLKMDVLGLGMLTCIRKSFDLVNAWPSRAADAPRLELHTVPPEDPDVYDMICRADTIGVFQIESRAQMTMLPRLQPRCYYDLVIEVAIVRPGPIQGKMVHPYLRRRCGEEPVSFPDEAIRGVLGRTLGVPLFQEQAMKLAIVAAGFSAGEADQLRRAMAAWKRKGDLIHQFGRRIIDGMMRRGYSREFAERCFDQIKGFGEYGFPESHAASFALLVYISAYLKHHHPAAFAAALINSQPMGFYQPAQIIRDLKNHGGCVFPVDVNHSGWDCTLEPDEHGQPALRLGMRLVKGMRCEAAERICDVVHARGPFTSILSLFQASAVRASDLRPLALADAFASMGLNRQEALWQLRRLRDERLPLFDAPDALHTPGTISQPTTSIPHVPAVLAPVQPPSPRSFLPPMSEQREVALDYACVGLTLRSHPMHFLRDQVQRLGAVPADVLKDDSLWPHGRRVAVAGVVLMRQRPQTAGGTIFMTIEDETGIANIILRTAVFERYRTAARFGVFILVRGSVQRSGQVTHVLAEQVEDLHAGQHARVHSRDFH